MPIRCLAGLSIIAFLFLTGCEPRLATKTGTPVSIVPLPQVEKITTLPSRPSIPTPTEFNQVFSDRLPVYRMDAMLDYDAKTLDVRQTIDFTNNSPIEIPNMLLDRKSVV